MFSKRKFQAVRTAHIQTRIPLGDGTFVTNGSGVLSTLGGSAAGSGSTAFVFRMSNFGWLQDLATHFAFWKLHHLRLRINPTFVSVSGATGFANGVGEIGITDDPYLPGSFSAGASNVLEQRCSKEWLMSKEFVLDYSPIGEQAGWLYCESQSATSGTSPQVRLATAGTIIFSTAVSSFASAGVGRVTLELDVSFKGSRSNTVVSLAAAPAPVAESKREAPTEEKKESPATATGAQARLPLASISYHPPEGYELVELPPARLTASSAGLGLLRKA